MYSSIKLAYIMKTILRWLFGVGIVTLCVYNISFNFSFDKSNPNMIHLTSSYSEASMAEPKPIDNYEDCHCPNDKVGCTTYKGHTCETGILCSPQY